MPKRIILFICGLVPLVIAGLAVLWLLRPWSQYGIGSHEESFEGYTVRIPFGWTGIAIAPGDAILPGMAEIHKGLIATGSIWFSSCVVRIESSQEYEAELKDGRKFPNVDFTQIANAPPAVSSPITKLEIDGKPFEKVYWTVKSGKREIQSVEYRSIPKGSEDVLVIAANPGFGLPSELAQAEYLILSLKQKK